MTYTGIIHFFGGVGLLLLGMRLMTDGLRIAAGSQLRGMLARGTTTQARAVGSGFAITAVVQSSSAVTFATIGFVNAGLLALPAAIGVIYGANLGTTVTSWLVATVGFKLELKAIALPAIALGMALRIGFGRRRKGALGEALAGFGVFFIGVDLLKEAFEGMDALVQVDREGQGVLHLLSFAGVGFLMTLVMQSSSATIAITLSAAASGVVPLPVAAVMVIGADVGTTSTAVLASIGATSAARRAAAAHVLFNLVLAAAALLMLPALMWLVRPLEPAIALAAFHTLTKVAALALMWPLTTRLTSLLERRFRSGDEDAARPRFLDRNVGRTPVLALNALAQELERAHELARNAATTAVGAPPAGSEQVAEACDNLTRLLGAINEFADGMSRDSAQAEPVVRALRVGQYLADIAERAGEYVERGIEAGQAADAESAAGVRELRTRALAVLTGAGDGDAAQSEFELHYQSVKAQLLRAGAEGRLQIRQMAAILDQLSALRRLLDQAVKAARNLNALHAEVQASPTGT